MKKAILLITLITCTSVLTACAQAYQPKPEPVKVEKSAAK